MERLIRLLAVLVLASPIVTAGLTGRESTGSGVASTGLVPSRSVAAHHPSGPVNAGGLYRGHTAAYWAAFGRHRTRQLQTALRHLHRRWQPTVDYAIRLASAVTGVPQWQLRSVGTCESHLFPFAQNGRYKGVMQLGWSPFGFSPFDPVANVLSAAMTVVRDGSWRQWECKP